MKNFIIGERYVYLPLHKLVMCFNREITSSEVENILNSEWANTIKEYNNELLRKPNNSCTFENLHPYNMGILPTNECNLRCRYCYSETGEKPKQNLSRTQIRHFINLLVKNAVLHSKVQNRPIESKLVISGGGEPTFQWEIFQYIVEYFSLTCRQHDINKNIVLITNGIMSNSHADYVIDHIDQINLSADGFPEIQNAQRPTENEKNSFPYVDRFIRKCEERRKTLLVRATVLSDNFNKMSEICQFFFDNYINIETLHFEPLFYVGRGGRFENSHYKMLMQFLDSYIEAYNYVSNKYPTKQLYNSSFCYQLQEYFCSASLGLNPWLHMDGNILPCTDHLNDPELVVANINDNGISVKKSFKKMIYNLNKCTDCFAYYHCGGGCPHNIEKDAEGNNLNPRSEAYCKMVAEYWKRAITSIGQRKAFCDLQPVSFPAGEYENLFHAYKIKSKEKKL